MARLKRYLYSLASGYVMLAANIVYTLASVPLALHYLSKTEFGLWALTSQFAFYLSLLDFGMSGAATRILIDHKDAREGTGYGDTIMTGFLVNLAHAGLIILVGGVCALLLGPALGVPAEMQMPFRWLIVWQSLILVVSSGVRTFGAILMAHQRSDLVNLSQTLLFAVSFGVLWLCLRGQQGVYSLAWAQGAGQALGALATVAGCVALKLLPASGCWGRPTWARFRELFAYGRDMFLYSLGNLLINFSQTLLITRVLGLDVAAVWSVCTRAFSMVSQFIYRIFDFSVPALGEMIVRKEKELLFKRFKAMVILSCSASAVAGLCFAVGNQGFTQWWTRGEIGWAPVNDGLLGAWLVLLVLVRSHTGLVGLTKEFRFLRYLYLCEGLFFVAAGFLGLHWGGVPGMLAVSIVGSLSISVPYSLWRTAEYFGLSGRTVAMDWLWPTLRLGLMLLPAALLLYWLLLPLPPMARLLLGSGGLGALGALLCLRFGLDDALRQELAARVPQRLGWLGAWIRPG